MNIRNKITTACAAFCAAAMLAAPASAASIREDAQLQSIILTTFVVELTKQRCPDVSIRMIRAQRSFAEIAKQVTAKGYTQTQMKDELQSKEAQARHMARAEEYIRARGADPAQPASVCAFADAEMKARTEVGKLLKR